MGLLWLFILFLVESWCPVLILKELFLFALGELLSKAVEIMAVLPYAIFEPKLFSSALSLGISDFIKLQV